jgi:hypothetical protein
MSDQPVTEASTYAGQHNIETQETNMYEFSGIRTRDPSNQAAADLGLRPRGYRGRREFLHVVLKCLALGPSQPPVQWVPGSYPRR